MPLPDFIFDPVNGWFNEATFPDYPATTAQTRSMMQRLYDQIKTHLGLIKTEVNTHQAESALKHITESGTNANGKYIKFDDGTMICNVWLKLLYASATMLNGTWTFPSAFATSKVDAINPSLSTKANTGANDYLIGGVMGGITILNASNLTVGAFDRTLVNITLNVSSGFVAGDYIWSPVIAIGRWK